MGYSPWGHKESDTTERLYFTASLVQLTLITNMHAHPVGLEGYFTIPISVRKSFR